MTTLTFHYIFYIFNGESEKLSDSFTTRYVLWISVIVSIVSLLIGITSSWAAEKY